MAFVPIPVTDTDQESPITEELMTQLAANAQENRDDLEAEHDAAGGHTKALGANLNMGGFKPTNLGEGVGTTDAVRADRALSSTDGSISGVGNFTANRDLQVVDDTNIQQVIVSLNGTPVATRSEINFVTPPSLGDWNVVDNPGQNRVDFYFQPDSQVANLSAALSGLWVPSQSDRLVGTPQFLTTTPATIGLVSASRTCWRVYVHVIHVGAPTDADEGFDLHLVPNGDSAADANKIWTRTQRPLKPGEFVEVDLRLTLPTGGFIVARSAATSTKLAIRCTIWETTDAAFIPTTPVVLTTSYVTVRTITALAGAVSVILHNYGSVEAGAAVALRPAAAGSDSEAYNVLSYQDGLLQPGELKDFVLPHALAVGDLIRLRASAGTTISARVSTMEF